MNLLSHPKNRRPGLIPVACFLQTCRRLGQQTAGKARMVRFEVPAVLVKLCSFDQPLNALAVL